MKNISKCLVIVAGLAFGSKASAQTIPTYLFTQYVGTYVPITGGIAVNSSTWDDQNWVDPNSAAGIGNPATGPGIPIGFNFTFGGLVYDVFGVNNNGYIFLGQSALTPAVNNNQVGASYWANTINFTNSTAPAALQARIGPFSGDMYGTTANGGSEIRVQTLGVSPNRVCVVQWSNTLRGSGGFPVNMQVRMYEGSNAVECTYGSSVANTTGNVSVGLRGSCAASDFNMRNVTAPATWSTSNAAAACTDVANYSTTLFPTNGLVYRWYPPIQCAGIPLQASVLSTETLVCPGSGNALLSMVQSYTALAGLTYTWQSSSTPVGPFTDIPGSQNMPSLTTPTINASTYYQLVVTCANAVGNSTSAVTTLLVGGTTTSVVPYYESFEGIGKNNRLPNCSWSASNIPNTTLTYTMSNSQGRTPRTGNNFASFFNNPAGTNYYYTNGIQLFSGITYSASLWYQTEYFGYNNWSNLTISYGMNQTPAGLVPIVSTNGAAISNVYKQLSNTFQVPASGLYYIAISATGAGGSAPWLSWDDLSITIPCDSASHNSPTLTLLTNTTSICSGDMVNLTISGADSYAWNTGANTSNVTEYPSSNITYFVTGTNSLTGCTSMLSQHITVYGTPTIFIAAPAQTVCPGTPVNLQGLGANNVMYSWDNGMTGQNITVSPTQATAYNLSATAQNGCVGTTSVMISVYNTPTVNATTNRVNDMCAGESATLSASGSAVSFQWMSNTSSVLNVGNPIVVYPTSTSVYTVMGTDVNGCHKSSTVVQNVSACVGITEQNMGTMKVYPNPTAGEIFVESNNSLDKTVEVIDITGKTVYTITSNEELVKIDMMNLSNGVYHVKIRSNSSVEVVKVVKY